LSEFLQILQNPKYTSDLNETLVAKITAMIQNALSTLTSNKRENNTLDQTIETEDYTATGDKLKAKMSHKDDRIKKESKSFENGDENDDENDDDNEYDNDN